MKMLYNDQDNQRRLGIDEDTRYSEEVHNHHAASFIFQF